MKVLTLHLLHHHQTDQTRVTKGHWNLSEPKSKAAWSWDVKLCLLSSLLVFLFSETKRTTRTRAFSPFFEVVRLRWVLGVTMLLRALLLQFWVKLMMVNHAFWKIQILLVNAAAGPFRKHCQCSHKLHGLGKSRQFSLYKFRQQYLFICHWHHWDGGKSK